MKKETLKPCPFCGQEHTTITESNTEGILDVIVDSLANLIVGSFARKCGKALPTVLFGAVFNGIVVGAELSIVYGSPFLLNAVCVAAGEAVSLLVGALLYHLVGKRLESIWR